MAKIKLSKCRPKCLKRNVKTLQRWVFPDQADRLCFTWSIWPLTCCIFRLQWNIIWMLFFACTLHSIYVNYKRYIKKCSHLIFNFFYIYFYFLICKFLKNQFYKISINLIGINLNFGENGELFDEYDSIITEAEFDSTNGNESDQVTFPILTVCMHSMHSRSKHRITIYQIKICFSFHLSTLKSILVISLP